MKNIVICCDGTDNKLSVGENTNVIHLYSCLEKNENQITYYNPGVGTIVPPGIKNKIRRHIHRFTDLFTASSLAHNVRDAYVFLMNNYQTGDKIYLFGFSRGAYTVRMLSGILKMFGLLHSGNENHFHLILQHYSVVEEKFNLGNSFKKRFCTDVDVHFMGIFDTVVSVGGLINYYVAFPYSNGLPNVKTVRHAVAIDEQRKHYRFAQVDEEHADLKEVFFAGVHSDIGGSYKEDGLSKITLEWMMGEASNKGLTLNKERVNRYVYGIEKNNKKGTYNPPNFKEVHHKSLTLKFKIADLFPRLRFRSTSWFFNIWIDWALWPKRKIKDGAMVHISVFQKVNFKENGHTYQPSNLKFDKNIYDIVLNGEIEYFE